MITIFNCYIIDTPKYQQNSKKRFLVSVGYCVSAALSYCLVGKIQWHCGPNNAHGPEFETYALWQVTIII